MIYYLSRFCTFIFSIILYPFDLISPILSIVVLSALSSIIILFVIKFLSNQKKIKRHKSLIMANIIRIYLYQHNLKIIIKSLKLFLKHNISYLLNFFIPILISCIPISIFIFQIYGRYYYQPPNLGDTILVKSKFSGNFKDIYTLKMYLNNKIINSNKLLRIENENEIWLKVKIKKVRNQFLIAGKNIKAEFEIDPGKNILKCPNIVPGSADSKLLVFYPVGKPVSNPAIKYIQFFINKNYLTIFNYEMDPIIFYFILTIMFALLLKNYFRVEF